MKTFVQHILGAVGEYLTERTLQNTPWPICRLCWQAYGRPVALFYTGTQPNYVCRYCGKIVEDVVWVPGR
jgi:hypothetical protein